ncbi:PE family protein [Nocardia sp. NPDC052566]|uniref:PE family protein n=1 Tax=Nocardia sp. NPDC052566 TaxID=3364330 RepID=UPI0037CC297A
MANSGVAFGGVQFDPAAARDAAARLDGLAERLERELSAGEPALRVAPAGIDEVSLRAAATMTDVAVSYSESASAGTLELRKLAASLRSQAIQFGNAESESVDALGGVGSA